MVKDFQRLNQNISAKVGQLRIAQRVNRSVCHVKRCIRKLKKLGLLSASRPDIYSCNEYVCMDSPDDLYIPIYQDLIANTEYKYNDKYAYCYLYNKKINSNVNVADELKKGKSLEELQYINFSMHEIADFLKVTMQTARNVIKSMVKNGLIEDIQNGYKKGNYNIKLKSIYELLQSDDGGASDKYNDMLDLSDTVEYIDNSNAVKPVTRAVIPTIKDISNTVSNVVQTTVDSVKNTVKNKFIPYSDNAIADFINQIKENNNAPVFIQDLE